VFVDDRAVAAEVLVNREALVRHPQQVSQAALTVFNSLAPYVFAVYFKQVERTKDRARITSVAADEIKHSKTVIVANDSLTVDDAGSNGQRLNRCLDEREAIRKVIAVSRRQPNAAPSAMRQYAETVMLDFMNPAQSRRRHFGRHWQARLKPGKGFFSA